MHNTTTTTATPFTFTEHSHDKRSKEQLKRFTLAAVLVCICLQHSLAHKKTVASSIASITVGDSTGTMLCIAQDVLAVKQPSKVRSSTRSLLRWEISIDRHYGLSETAINKSGIEGIEDDLLPTETQRKERQNNTRIYAIDSPSCTYRELVIRGV